MATTIVPGPGVYYEDFAGGQGAGFSNYFVYAPDQDTNFVTLRQTVNQLVAEVRAIQGPNAALAVDVEVQNDPAAPELSGRVGDHSYFVSIQGGDTTKLDLTAGQFILNSLKVEAASPYVIPGSGTAGTRWVAIDINGVPALSDAQDSLTGSGGIDLCSVNWDGAQFTGAITELVPIFFDGDEWADFKSRPANAPTWAQKDYRQGGDRVLAIERLLAGLATDGDAAAIGPQVFADGLVGAPSVTFLNEQTSGLYRRSGGGLGYVVGGQEVIRTPSDRFMDFPLQPMATATGTVNASASGAWDSIPFVTVEQQTPANQIDTGGGNPERYTVPTGGDGDYVAHVIVVFDETTGTGAGTYRMARLVKDLGGSPTNYPIVSATPNGGTAEPTSVAFTVELPGLSAGDHLTIQGRQDDGAIMDMDLRASFRKVA